MQWILVLAAISLFAISNAVDALAQPAAPPVAQSGAILPTGQGIASLIVADGRKVAIDRQAAQDKNAPLFVYFYEPIFVLKENPTPLPGYPNVVLRTYPLNGLTYLRFGLILSDPAATAAAKQVIAAADPDFAAAPQRPTIVMDPWPVEYISASIKSDEGDDATLGTTWPSGPIANNTGYKEFDIGFNPDDLARFKADAANGYINFEYGYSYTNASVAFATISTSFKSNALGAINTALSSVNTASGMLFQDDYNQLSESLNTQYASYIYASDPTLIPYLQTTVLQQLYKPTEVAWNTPDPNMQAALDAYAQPLIQKYATKNTQDHSVTHDVTKDLKLSAGFGGASISPEMKDDLQTKDGITLEQDQTTQTYQPSTITVYQRTSSSIADVVNTAQDVYISKGPSATWSLDEVPIAVSSSKVSYGGTSAQSQFVGIAPGMAICFLSDGPVPDGYLALDGNSNWPTWSWVPAADRGKTLPDTTNSLTGGGDTSNVGQITPPGTISVGGSLTVTDQSSALFGVSGYGGDNVGLFGSTPKILSPPPAKITFHYPIQGINNSNFVNEFDVAAIPEVSNVSGNLIGNVPTTAAPPFLRCRWIVRSTP